MIVLNIPVIRPPLTPPIMTITIHAGLPARIFDTGGGVEGVSHENIFCLRMGSVVTNHQIFSSPLTSIHTHKSNGGHYVFRFQHLPTRIARFIFTKTHSIVPSPHPPHVCPPYEMVGVLRCAGLHVLCKFMRKPDA